MCTTLVKTRESLGHPLGVASHTCHLGFQREDLEKSMREVVIISYWSRQDLRVFLKLEKRSYVINSCNQVEDLVKQFLEKQRLSHGDVLTYGTPHSLCRFMLIAYVIGK